MEDSLVSEPPSTLSKKNNKPTKTYTAFRKQFYPDTTDQDWNDWHWQIANKITSLDQLVKIFNLEQQEKDAILKCHLPVGLTPYYTSLLFNKGNQYPLRKTMIPTILETIEGSGESIDPLHESKQSPVEGLVHRYPDRVLFLVSNVCSCYCRYCTRSRIVGQTGNQILNRDHWNLCLEYIRKHKEIRDVLLSGGDPLLLSDELLDWLLDQIRSIKHVEMIRIGTKVPAVLPQRITSYLVKILKDYHPLFMSLHFTHPDELTNESKKACCRLVDAGIPLGSQTVLLKGINDSVDILKELFHKLLMVRVKPYYLYQCDPIIGSEHFRTKISDGIGIMKKLRGYTSGYAIPMYVIDAPGGGGKIPISENCIISEESDRIVLRNYEGNEYFYPV